MDQWLLYVPPRSVFKFISSAHTASACVLYGSRNKQILFPCTFSSFVTKCHNSKSVIFEEKRLKVLKCYNCLRVQRRHNCSPAASFANSVMTLYLLKVRLQTFLSIPINQKYQILSCDTLVVNERCNIN